MWLRSKTKKVAGVAGLSRLLLRSKGYQIVTGDLISLFEQELVDCDTSYNEGSNRGLINYAFEFITLKKFTLTQVVMATMTPTEKMRRLSRRCSSK